MRRALEERLAAGLTTSLDRLLDGLMPLRLHGTAVELVGWSTLDFASIGHDEPADALLSALDDAQDVVMHATTQPWPCPGAEPQVRVEGELARLWFTRPSGAAIEMLPVWLTAGIEGVAQVLEGRFRLRVGDRASGRVDADFELIIRMPEGHAERWRFDWGLHGVDVGRLDPECDHRALFDPVMRNLFDDHLYDLHERGLVPDRDYDDVPMALEIPKDVLAVGAG